MQRKTYIPKPGEVDRKWILFDAKGRILGRMAAQIARVLMGKHKVLYVPHMEIGDYVVVLNAAKVRVTGKKEKQKVYRRYTGYPGGLREVSLEVLREKKPEEIIRHAVKGMLPKNRLGDKLLGRLHVYRAGEHPHAAQRPVPAA